MSKASSKTSETNIKLILYRHLLGIPWGFVNYFWAMCSGDHHYRNEHVHLVWQEGDQLFRDCLFRESWGWLEDHYRFFVEMTDEGEETDPEDAAHNDRVSALFEKRMLTYDEIVDGLEHLYYLAV